MSVAQRDLRLLGLEEWPVDAARVRRTFRTRLKQLHPDRNPRLRNWAERRTRELILAAERLLAQAEEETNDVGTTTGSGQPGQNGIGEDRGDLTLQLMRSAGASYAVPIDDLIAVAAAGDVLRNGLFGPYALYRAETFPVATLDGAPLQTNDVSGVLLFARAGADPAGSVNRFAVALSRELRPLRIIHARRQELIQLHGTDAGCIVSANETFLVPGIFGARS